MSSKKYSSKIKIPGKIPGIAGILLSKLPDLFLSQLVIRFSENHFQQKLFNEE
jgi:hypothetical protein